MSRKPAILKHVVELYLIIVGGVSSLTAAVGTAVARWDLTHGDEIEGVRADLRVDLRLFLFGLVLLVAGIGIRKFRFWGLILTLVLSSIVVGYSGFEALKAPVDYHEFTIGLPMAAILLWALLPSTWSIFRSQSVKPL